MSIKIAKYHDGDIVIVDRSSSGKGYHFGKVISSEPIKLGCNDSFNYEIEGLEYKTSEYYIRRAKPEDLELKKLYEELDIANFEIDDDKIKRDFWESQKEVIKTTCKFLNNFLYPYLKTKGHIITIDKMTDWDTNYNIGFATKSEYIFIIPHDRFNIIVQKNSTYVTLYINLPHWYNKDKEVENKNKNTLAIITMAVKYSDDEYTKNFITITKEIISQFEKEEGCYHLWLSSDIIDSVNYYKEVLKPCSSISEKWHESLPGYEYTRALFDLTVMRHYFFNSNFTLREQ